MPELGPPPKPPKPPQTDLPPPPKPPAPLQEDEPDIPEPPEHSDPSEEESAAFPRDTDYDRELQNYREMQNVPLLTKDQIILILGVTTAVLFAFGVFLGTNFLIARMGTDVKVDPGNTLPKN